MGRTSRCGRNKPYSCCYCKLLLENLLCRKGYLARYHSSSIRTQGQTEELTTEDAAGGCAVAAAATAAIAASRLDLFPREDVTTAGAVLVCARSFAEAVLAATLSAGTASDLPRETTTAEAPRPGAADAAGDRTAPATAIALAHNAER